MKDIMDITPEERYLLSRLKRKPGMFLGNTSLTKFSCMAYGYSYAMQITGQVKQHNLLPDGLNDYAAMKYLDKLETPHSCYSLILKQEPDEEKAFYIFFDLLDEYLIHIGFNPLPIYDDKK